MIRYSCYRPLQEISSSSTSRHNILVFFQQCRFLSHAQLNQQNVITSPTSSFNSRSYSDLLKDCIANSKPDTGKSLHCNIIKSGACVDLFAWNILLNFYVKSNLLRDARKLFDEMLERNVVSFVTMIQGYSQALQYIEAIQVFLRLHKEGHDLNPHVFTTILKTIVSMERSELAWNIHACVYKLGHSSNPFVGTALVDAYSVCGLVDMAKTVFDGIASKDMVSWTGMVSSYAENDCFEEAFGVFLEMQNQGFKPNNFTLTSLLKASLGLNAINVGKSVHGCALKSRYETDSYVSVSLLDLYTKLGIIEDARQVFDEIPKKDVIPWSFMIARYSQSNLCNEAVELFSAMRQTHVVPNQFTIASVLQACATMGSFLFGTQIHCHVVKVGHDSDIYVSNALMDVYAKCGELHNSIELFYDSSYRNDVTWNTLIVGYVQFGDGEKALNLFADMLEDQMHPTEVTYSSVLRACSSLAALEPGIQIHSLTVKTLYDKENVVANTLIDMYAKCGNIKDARKVFNEMMNPDVITWNAMISAYSLHGISIEALKIFESMQKSNTRPNQLTFVGVLSACSNMGLLDKGQGYFDSMVQKYGIEPCIEHYTCMVSLLGKLGFLNKAMKLIEEIPLEPSVMVWRSLLGACVTHNDVEIGKISAQRVLEMEPDDESSYVLLSNIYATSKRWDNVASVRKKMKKKGLKKEQGLSWIENQGIVHYFAVGDSSHPDIRLINGMLELFNLKMKRSGYVPNCSAVLLDVEDDEKARLLWLHSERLALAFALVRTPIGSPIRIMKNLRICMDCHGVIKLISSMVDREIIVRDINRFHHFQNGVCSCGDYW